jgi:hypothetical protein
MAVSAWPLELREVHITVAVDAPGPEAQECLVEIDIRIEGLEVGDDVFTPMAFPALRRTMLGLE